MPEESTPVTSADASADAQRGRSTIEFAYLDLDNAVDIAKAIHTLSGDRCEWNQLAARLNVAAEGGGFRQRMLNAKMYGLVTYERGQIALTDLGIHAADAEHEKRARIDAFLAVPLFKQLFETFDGKQLPPVTAIEATCERLGVAPKQRDKARQVFMRSAKQAGFFDLAGDRLTMPPGSSVQRQNRAPSPQVSVESNGNNAANGNAKALHPFIQGLLDKLPGADDEWSLEARAKWLTTAANIFDLMYTSTDPYSERQIVITLTGKKGGTE